MALVGRTYLVATEPLSNGPKAIQKWLDSSSMRSSMKNSPSDCRGSCPASSSSNHHAAGAKFRTRTWARARRASAAIRRIWSVISSAT